MITMLYIVETLAPYGSGPIKLSRLVERLEPHQCRPGPCLSGSRTPAHSQRFIAS